MCVLGGVGCSSMELSTGVGKRVLVTFSMIWGLVEEEVAPGDGGSSLL